MLLAWALVATAVAVVLVAMVWRARERERAAAATLHDVARELGGTEESDVRRSVAGEVAHLQRALRRVTTDLAQAKRWRSRVVAALDSTHLGVVVAAADGEVHRNAAATHFLGVRSSDALVDEIVGQLLRRALAGEPQRRTLELFGPPRRVVAVTATPFTDAAGSVAALAVVEDVTDKRRLEAARTDFVANISHELKTPVGALALLAETLADEEDQAVARRLHERMVAEAHRVGRIIDDLLELSRIETGPEVRAELVPVSVLVAEAVERVRPTAELRGITITVAEPNRRLGVQGDRTQLASALGNLVENAVKYSDEGGEVTVTASTDGRSVELCVEDRGIGIPARDLDRIFERFYRVDRGRSRETGGTGLGLAIVRHVVQNHDGAVFVRSQEGVGSTFTLRLPAGPGPVAMSDAEAV